jgi:hypothetical protein
MRIHRKLAHSIFEARLPSSFENQFMRESDKATTLQCIMEVCKIICIEIYYG